MTLRTRATVVAWSFAALFAYAAVDMAASTIWRGGMKALGFEWVLVGFLKNWTMLFGFWSYSSVMDGMQRVPALSRVRRGFVTFGGLVGVVVSSYYTLPGTDSGRPRPNAWLFLIAVLIGWGVGAFLGTFAPKPFVVRAPPPEPARDLSWLGVQKR